MGDDEAVPREERLRRLIEAGRALTSELDPETLLTRVLDEAVELTGARYAALGVLDESREGLERFLTRGIDDAEHRAIGDLPRGRGILGLLIEEPRPLRLNEIGEHPSSYGFPSGHPPMSTFLGVPVLIRGRAWGNLYLTEKAGGTPFDADDEEAAVILAAWAGIAIENARLYGRVEERREELERSVRSFEATTAIARAIGAETRLDRVLELVVKRARALVDARAVALLLRDGSGFGVRAWAGELPRLAQDLIVDVPADVLDRGGRSRPDADVAPVHDLLTIGASGALLVPLTHRGRVTGLLAAFDRRERGPHFDDEDERLMHAFAASAASALVVAQSVAQDRLRRSIEAAEAERRRWARELHDETLQGLAGLRVRLGSARDAPEDRLRATAAEAVDQLATEIESLRALITELRPAALDQLGLRPALEALVERMATTSGVEAALEFSVADRLSPELEGTVYRVVQEALTNVGKHARAERVTVTVTAGSDGLEVSVRDDGTGFQEADHDGEGFGLLGMRERIALADGEVTVRSDAGGTEVAATLPLRYPDDRI